MKTLRTADELRAEVGSARKCGARIAFVPTMGALHEGHLSLVDVARRVGDLVVMSLFVNPLQFGPNEDFHAYPRNELRDETLAAGRGVDVLFLPEIEEVHPPNRTSIVSVRGMLTSVLEGAARPGHFDGVTTVVASLFHIANPHVAVFGQKDAQQVAVVKKMVRDLRFGIEIVVAPTIRDTDGLALSSRNVYLSPAERKSATILFKALSAGAASFDRNSDPALAEAEMAQVFEMEQSVSLEYAKVVDPDTFEPPQSKPVLLAVAARVGGARLIDNLIVG